jgi:hypothetical protein
MSWMTNEPSDDLRGGHDIVHQLLAHQDILVEASLISVFVFGSVQHVMDTPYHFQFLSNTP